jgi:hypothetical protein
LPGRRDGEVHGDDALPDVGQAEPGRSQRQRDRAALEGGRHGDQLLIGVRRGEQLVLVHLGAEVRSGVA